MNFNNQNYFVFLYAIFVSNHRQSNSKLHHAAAEMNKVDVLYSIGMKTSSNFVTTAIHNIIAQCMPTRQSKGGIDFSLSRK